ncbi:hypothetical protein FKP32DRAFT_1673036 [Trametes sanguinea]|nr:hypothetical protein FKP32DRAFT_1673036 [Trametes sanguinea]
MDLIPSVSPSGIESHGQVDPRSRQPTPTTSHGRPVRTNRSQLPKRYHDYLPQGPTPLLPPPPELPSDDSNLHPAPEESVPAPAELSSDSSGSIRSDNDGVSCPPPLPVKRTPPNRFGLLREYPHGIPAIDPEDEVALVDLADDTLAAVRPPLSDHSRGLLIAPYPNISSYLFGRWYWNGSEAKSESDRNDLLRNCILHPEFNREDLRDINWKKLDQDLAATSPDNDRWGSRDGWRHTDVVINVPFGRPDQPPRPFTVRGLGYRSLVEVITTVCSCELSAGFHYTPYRLLWQPPAGPDGHQAEPQQVHGELYSSPAFLQAHAELEATPREPGCNLPRAIIACMAWSDSTHLAEYGNTSLWPAYLLFGNQSKYARARPSTNACHHIAYIPKIPDEIEDFIHQHTDKADVKKILTHCRRELMHAVWRILLGDGFVEACRHGIVVKCYDGITRRLYPRFFTYSADYPEKVLLATIRDMGNCPCPRCLIPKNQISALGSRHDMQLRTQSARTDDSSRWYDVAKAHSLIYEKGKGIGSSAVEAILKPRSLVPTQNVFSERLSEFLPNYHSLFVPDLLHEWDLGVWKGLMTHLIRILQAEKGATTRELNSRFRQVPVFGRDTIRRFRNNLADMKQMAAHDFEDALQCFIPAYEGLLSEPHNSIVLDLLFDTASLHALHSLRMQVDATVSVTRAFLERFARELRRFKQKTCEAYHTVELPKEVEARRRHQQQTDASKRISSSTNGPSGMPHGPQVAVSNAEVSTMPVPRKKEYNMNTYKIHSLGDYPDAMVSVGTLDSYTTRLGELAHRAAKYRYSRTSKKGFVKQISDIERRESRLHHMAHELSVGSSHADSSESPTAATGGTLSTGDYANPEVTEGEFVSPTVHHHIGTSQKAYEYLPQFVRRHLADPAVKSFIPKLKAHLRRRIDGQRDDADIPEDDARTLLFEHDRIFRHQTMQVNYTTYDVRRGQDIIHISTDHCNVMVQANEDPAALVEGPADGSDNLGDGTLFWYAQVLGIYHANVLDMRGATSPAPVRMEFLHVRWFGRDPEWRSGWDAKRLDRVGFVPASDEGAFGFLDPSDVIRACHLIPAYHEGRTRTLLGHSPLSQPSGAEDDWERYYVNRFVDRDMFMRFLGSAVGHGTPLHPSLVHLLGDMHPPASSNHSAVNEDDGPAAPEPQHAEQSSGLDLDEASDSESGTSTVDDYDSDAPFALL